MTKKRKLCLIILLSMIISIFSFTIFPKANKAFASDINDLGYPFAEGETWYVVVGYKYGNHYAGGSYQYAFDLVKNGISSQTGGATIKAPISGYIETYPISNDWGCGIRIWTDGYAIGYGIQLDHLSSCPWQNGTYINKNDTLGTLVSSAPGGINHLHIQIRYNSYTDNNTQLNFGVFKNFSDGGPSINCPIIDGFQSGGQYCGTPIINISNPSCNPPYDIRTCTQTSIPITLQAMNGNYMVAEGGGGGTVNANRTSAGSWESFNLIKLNEQYAAIKASNGKYISAYGGGGYDVTATGIAIDDWEIFRLIYTDYLVKANASSSTGNAKFKFIPLQGAENWELKGDSTNASTWESFKISLVVPTNDIYTIQSFHGPYLQAGNGDGNTIAAVSFIREENEKFKIVQISENTIAIQASNGKYLSAQPDGTVLATANTVDIWEKFTVENKVTSGLGYTANLKTYWGKYLIVRPGFVTFQSSYGTYMQAAAGGGSNVNTNGAYIGPWEKFTLSGIDEGFNKFVLLASNGNYVVAENGGGDVVNANRTAAGPYEKFTFENLGNQYLGIKAMNGNYFIAKLGHVSFETYNKHYLQALYGGGYSVNATPTSYLDWEKWTMKTL